MHSNRQTLACQSVSRASPHRMLHPHPHPHPHTIHFTSPPIALPLGSNVYLPCFGQLRFHVGALGHFACGRLAGNPLSRSPGGVATKTRPSGAQGFHRKSRAAHKKSTHNMLFHWFWALVLFLILLLYCSGFHWKRNSKIKNVGATKNNTSHQWGRPKAKH